MFSSFLLQTALAGVLTLVSSGSADPTIIGTPNLLAMNQVKAVCIADDNMADPDNDNLLNMYERFFNSDPCKADTDGDGYLDGQEVLNGYSPVTLDVTRIDKQDTDKDGLVDIKEVEFVSNPLDPDTDGDGLNDWQEFRWETDLKNPDTDGDGVSDGEEVKAWSDPNSAIEVVEKKIEIDISKQRLSYSAGGVVLGEFIISSGAPGYDTPKGEFQVHNKHPRAYSKRYGLYMPNWMAFTPNGLYGLHELPEWPGGYKEGKDHLGIPVSHGCVRLGEGDSQILYDFADIGTRITIK